MPQFQETRDKIRDLVLHLNRHELGLRYPSDVLLSPGETWSQATSALVKLFHHLALLDHMLEPEGSSQRELIEQQLEWLSEALQSKAAERAQAQAELAEQT